MLSRINHSSDQNIFCPNHNELYFDVFSLNEFVIAFNETFCDIFCSYDGKIDRITTRFAKKSHFRTIVDIKGGVFVDVPFIAILESSESSSYISIHSLLNQTEIKTIEIEEKITSFTILKDVTIHSPSHNLDNILFSFGTSEGLIGILSISTTSKDTLPKYFSNIQKWKKSLDNDSVFFINAYSVTEEGYYQYKFPKAKHVEHIALEHARITHINFIHQINSILIGFKFGGWQLWKLDNEGEFNPEILYTCSKILSGSIMSSCFLEPSDDPRYFCYFWIASSTNDESIRKASFCLYQMNFGEKILGEAHGSSRYNMFMGIGERLQFNIPINTLDTLDDTWKRSIKLSTIPHNNHLATFQWQQDHFGQHKLGIFSLDQWYHSQMPHRMMQKFFGLYCTDVPVNNLYASCFSLIPETIESYWIWSLVNDTRMSSLVAPQSMVKESLKSKNDLANKWALARSPLLAFLQPIALSFKAYCGISNKDDFNVSHVTFQSFQDSLWDQIETVFSQPDTSFDLITWLCDAFQANILNEHDMEILEEISRNKNHSDKSSLRGEFLLGRDHIAQEILMSIKKEQVENKSFLWFISGCEGKMDNFDQQGNETEEHTPKGKRMKIEEKALPFLYQPCDFQFSGPISWVICANSLLDHFKYKSLKNILGLFNKSNIPNKTTDSELHRKDLLSAFLLDMSQSNQISPIDIVRWIWFRFLRCKIKFDSLTHEEHPIFVSEDNCDFKTINYYEISRCYFQIDFLHSYTEYFNKIDLQEYTGREKNWYREVSRRCRTMLPSIAAFKDYTNVVCFFIKTGQLSDFYKKFEDGQHENIEFILPRYSSENIEKFLNDRRPFPITEKIYDMIFSDYNGDNEILKIWRKHENLSTDEMPVYPPKYLQTVCSLFQNPQVNSSSLFALLAFILLDTIGDYCDQVFNRSTGNSINMSKPEFCSRIQNQYLGLLRDRFPKQYYNLMDPIMIAWLIDRKLFKYLSVSSNFVNQKMLNDFENQTRSKLFLHPTSSMEQTKYLISVCLTHDQDHLINLLSKRDTFFIQPKSFLKASVSKEDQGISSPISVMIKMKKIRALRNTIDRQEWKSAVESIFAIVLKKHYLRQVLAQGLELEEATILLDLIRKHGHHAYLFNVFVSKSAFKEAILIYREASLLNQQECENYECVKELFTDTNKRLVESFRRRVGYLPHNELSPTSFCIGVNSKKSFTETLPNRQIQKPIDAESNMADIVQRKMSSRVIKPRRFTHRMIDESKKFINSSSKQERHVGKRRDRTPEKLSNDEILSNDAQKSLIKLIYTPPARRSKQLNKSFHFPATKITPVSIMKGKSENRTPRRLTFSLLEDKTTSPTSQDQNEDTISSRPIIKRKSSLLFQSIDAERVNDERSDSAENEPTLQATKEKISPNRRFEEQSDQLSTLESETPHDGSHNEDEDCSTAILNPSPEVATSSNDLETDYRRNDEQSAPLEDDDEKAEKINVFYFEKSASTLSNVDSESLSHNESFEDNLEVVEEAPPGEVTLANECESVIDNNDFSKTIIHEIEAETIKESQELSFIKNSLIDKIEKVSSESPVHQLDLQDQNVTETSPVVKPIAQIKASDDADNPPENDDATSICSEMDLESRTPVKVTRNRKRLVSTSSNKSDTDSLISSISRRQKLRSANKTAQKIGLPRLSVFDRNENEIKRSESAQPTSNAESQDESATSTVSMSSRPRGRPKKTPIKQSKDAQPLSKPSLKRKLSEDSPEDQTQSPIPLSKRKSIRVSEAVLSTPRRSSRLSRVQDVSRDSSPTRKEDSDLDEATVKQLPPLLPRLEFSSRRKKL